MSLEPSDDGAVAHGERDGPAADRRPRAAARTAGIALAGLVVGLLLLDWYAANFVRAERTLYHADQVAYWAFSGRLAQQLRGAPWEAVRSVAWSVATADLNLLPSVPVSLSMAIFGNARLVYVLSVLSLYGAAVLLALALLVARGADGALRGGHVAALGCAVLLLPTLWRPALIGYLDLGGVGLALVILALYLGQGRRPFATRMLLLIGALLALLVLFRRWYAVWALAFAITVVIDGVAGWWLARDRSRQGLVAAARVPFWIGLACAATLAVLAFPVMVHKLTTDYADIYSAYGGRGGIAHRLGEVLVEYGLAPLALCAGAAGLLLRWRETRRLALFLVPHLVLTYLVMVRIQDHSPQHWYLYAPGLLALTALALARVVGQAWPARSRIACLAAVALVGIAATLGMYWPRAGRLADAAGTLLPGHRVRPAIRHDLDQVERLLLFLDELTAASPGPIYVLSSSGVLAEQMLSFANWSLGTSFRSPALVLQASHVDKRDGFPRGLLAARHVLVASPVQVHLRPADQQVVVVPAEAFLEGRGLARAFRQHRPRFTLEGGVEVLVFTRVRPFEPAEIEELVAPLRAAYPDRPWVYSP